MVNVTFGKRFNTSRIICDCKGTSYALKYKWLFYEPHWFYFSKTVKHLSCIKRWQNNFQHIIDLWEKSSHHLAKEKFDRRTVPWTKAIHHITAWEKRQNPQNPNKSLRRFFSLASIYLVTKMVYARDRTRFLIQLDEKQS